MMEVRSKKQSPGSTVPVLHLGAIRNYDHMAPGAKSDDREWEATVGVKQEKGRA